MVAFFYYENTLGLAIRRYDTKIICLTCLISSNINSIGFIFSFFALPKKPARLLHSGGETKKR